MARVIVGAGSVPKKRLTEEGVRKLKPSPGKQMDYYDAGMPGLILRVSYGGTKSWRCLHYVQKRTKTHSLGRYPVLDLKQAREKARQFLADPQAAINKPAPETFRAVSEDFVKRYVIPNGLRSGHEIQRSLKKYLYPRWGERIFADIKRSDVRILLDEIEEKHGPSQADAVLALIRKMCNWHAARSDDYISPIVKGMRRTKPSEQERDRILNDEELRALWSATAGDDVFSKLVRVLLLTAQRRDKVRMMERASIVNGVWHIQSEKKNRKGTGEILPLPEPVVEIIDSIPIADGSSFVFPSVKRDRPFNSFSQRKMELDAKLRELIPDMPPWVLHDLRRTARSLMSRAGVRRDIGERVIGHKIRGVEGIYDRHSYEAERGEALKQLSALVSEIISPSAGKVAALAGRAVNKQQDIQPQLQQLAESN